jgi:hypothetical protein
MSSSQREESPSRLLPAPPLSRLAAVGVDGTTYLIIPALLIPVGLLLGRRGVTLSSLVVNGIGLAFMIAWILTAITYGWVLANLVLLLLRSGKPAHDRLARTVVARAQFLRTVPRAGSQCTADR